ncbi:MAG TPA: hypothetical protein VI844_00905 [Coxiellaceae bacterium]|nr:hypothetical protein [Coxiellaceae bacterium]
MPRSRDGERDPFISVESSVASVSRKEILRRASIVRELYFIFMAGLAGAACTTRDGLHDAQGFFPLMLMGFVWNSLELIVALLSLPNQINKARKSILHPKIKWGIVIASAMYFGLVLPVLTVLSFVLSVKDARTKGVREVFLKLDGTLGSRLALAGSDFAFAGGLLLQVILKSYAISQTTQKLMNEPGHGCGLRNNATDKLLKAIDCFDKKATVTLTDKRRAFLKAIRDNTNDCLDDLLTKQKEKFAQQGIDLIEDALGFVGALFSGLSMVYRRGHHNQLLAIVAATFYMLSALIRIYHVVQHYSDRLHQRTMGLHEFLKNAPLALTKKWHDCKIPWKKKQTTDQTSRDDHATVTHTQTQA